MHHGTTFHLRVIVPSIGVILVRGGVSYSAAMTFLAQFFPGQKVPTSGQYWVIHLKHRLPYRALLTQGERFPICKQCDMKVLFEYAGDAIQEGVSLQADHDFVPERPSVWSL